MQEVIMHSGLLGADIKISKSKESLKHAKYKYVAKVKTPSGRTRYFYDMRDYTAYLNGLSKEERDKTQKKVYGTESGISRKDDPQDHGSISSKRSKKGNNLVEMDRVRNKAKTNKKTLLTNILSDINYVVGKTANKPATTVGKSAINTATKKKKKK